MDLRPGYRELAPPPGSGLACLWVHVAAPAARPVRILPDACVDLIWQQGSGAHLAGPDTTAAVADLLPGSVLLGARFAPGAGGRVHGLPLSELRDARLSLPGLLDGDLAPADALRALVAEARRLADPDAAVQEAARRLADPRQRVDDLAADLGLSERQLRRRCLAAAGHAPKALQRVLRFSAFVAAADLQPQPDLAWMAAEHGYADQSHLTGECTALAGLPPAALIRARRGGAGEPAAP